MADALTETKYQVAVANRVLAATGLASGVTAALGHASMRVPGQPDRFVVKGRGYALDALSAMRPADMILCDTEGNYVDGPPGSTQCFEVKMHSCIYRLHPDVQSVVHIHPRFTVLLTSLGRNLKPLCQEGVELVHRPLPLYPHMKIIVSDEEGSEVARLMTGFKAVLLQGHGATTTGETVDEAVTNMLQLEEQARMNYYALAAMGPDFPGLPEDIVAEQLVRPDLAAQPHFREPMARTKGQPRVNGVWQYYAKQVSADL